MNPGDWWKCGIVVRHPVAQNSLGIAEIITDLIALSYDLGQITILLELSDLTQSFDRRVLSQKPQQGSHCEDPTQLLNL